MADLDKAVATQLANIEKRTGKSLSELGAIVRGSGIEKHGELVAMLKSELGMGHGDANTLVHYVKQQAAPSTPAGADPLNALYVGPKAALRPIHDKLLAALNGLGSFEIAPKKTYVSYRRAKQFAMIGPATNTRAEVGLNVKTLPESARLIPQGAGRMCNYIVRLTDISEVDAELLGWVEAAYQAAGS